jgi:hypothetical protein
MNWNPLLLLAEQDMVVHDRNGWLFLVFASYVIIIFVFANIYSFLYRKRPGSFAFNADVLRSQSAEFLIATEHAIETRLKQITYFRHLLEELLENQDLIDPTRMLTSSFDYVVTSKYGYKFTSRTYSARMVTVTLYYVSVFDLNDQELATLQISSEPQDRDQMSKVIGDLVKGLESDVHEHRSRLESLSTDWPKIWTFWDFLYFSTITQTTVGYGDILPNKTVVRVIVIVQIVVGLLMIGILINIVLPRFI